MTLAIDWAIVPHEGFACCRLGDLRADVHRRVGPPDSVFERVPGADPTETHDAVGLQVTYSAAGQVTAIEVAEPAAPTLDGVPLLGRRPGPLFRRLRRAGVAVVVDPDDPAGADLPSVGVGLYLDARVESVSFEAEDR